MKAHHTQKSPLKKKKPHLNICILDMDLKVFFFQQKRTVSFAFDFLMPSGKVNKSEKSLQK